ncbi:MAG: hypothetical protein IPO83_17275 [Chitinophagaceae bacterium]|nr:hypothetical protein [Chitinophagaceae bacterium]
MSLAREEKHLPIIIAMCFIGNFILGGIGQSFSASSFGRILAWQWGSLLFMAGCSLYAAKLHTEKWHISSAGFIMLTIGQGIFYTLQNANSDEKDVALFAAGIMAFLPGMAFICYYSGFPVWLRIFSLIATIPFTIQMIIIDSGKYVAEKDMWLSTIGFIMIQLTGIFWSYYVIRPYQETKQQK